MHEIAACFEHIGRARLIKTAHVAQIPGDIDCSAFARRKGGCLGETGERLDGLLYFAGGRGEVGLQDFSAPEAADVLHARSEAHDGTGSCELCERMSEFRIGETVAEGEGGLCAGFVKKAISDEDPL